MKTYTVQEREDAKGRLPAPIADFVGSESLTNIYLGIRTKLKLNLRQLVIMTEIANLTLLGLEPEHALETNLHQYLPELSNADTKELAADLNDRVFKEAQRRLRENVTEPKKKSFEYYDEGEPGDEGNMPPASAVHDTPGNDSAIKVSVPVNEGPSAANAPAAGLEASSISLGKLAAPAQTKTAKAEINPTSGIQNVVISKPEEKPAPVTLPSTPAPAAPNPPTPPAPKEYKGTDPYREAPE
jgi:hypothetical protein